MTILKSNFINCPLSYKKNETRTQHSQRNNYSKVLSKKYSDNFLLLIIHQNQNFASKKEKQTHTVYLLRIIKVLTMVFLVMIIDSIRY